MWALAFYLMVGVVIPNRSNACVDDREHKYTHTYTHSLSLSLCLSVVEPSRSNDVLSCLKWTLEKKNPIQWAEVW